MINAVSRNDNLKEITKKIQLLKKEYVDQAKKSFKEAFKELWDNYPEIEAVVWTQYTPYFNDGETCYFSVGDMWPMTKKGYDGWKEDRGYAEEYSISSFVGEEELPEEKINEIELFLRELRELDDSIFLQMFDDHVEVVATRKGFSVEEYQHD